MALIQEIDRPGDTDTAGCIRLSILADSEADAVTSVVRTPKGRQESALTRSLRLPGVLRVSFAERGNLSHCYLRF